MKKVLLFFITALLFSCSQYRYETVKGDPTETRIYTLDNGLKVFLSKNQDQPRINAVIAVRVGAKNDPLETTGLAHYFEHLMFKGSERLGTSDYTAEKPLLDSIETLFEIYRRESDPDRRTAIYAKIDSVSQRASEIAIPNEYDKIMTSIGSTETNAWTSEDETCYIEDFPSNQLENWAAIQSDRFQHPVIRGFHTELETIYEEYNMYLASDDTKTYQAITEMLYPNHPYGMHDVLGKPEHLKNPSITNVKNYYSTYYVPNNYAICLSGDLDYDKTIAIIDKYFGSIAPNDNLPEWKIPEENPITSPLQKEVYGVESEYIMIGWRAPKAASEEKAVAKMASAILCNDKCALMDEDLLQTQSLMEAGTSYNDMTDEGLFILYATPKEGQTLDEAKDLLMGEVKKLREGDFDENLITGEIANLKRREMQRRQSNGGRVMQMINSFINGISWNDMVKSTEKSAKLTKADIADWASKNLRDDNFVIVYKRQGVDPNVKKIEKPKITPTQSNRDMHSAFLDSMQNVKPEPIEAKFIDFKKELQFSEISSQPFIYKSNSENGLYNLRYIFETGFYADPKLSIALKEYMPLLGTADKSAVEIQKELYSMATDFHIRVEGNRTEIIIEGLSENMDKALALIEDYLSNIKGDETILSELKKDIIKSRENDKFNQRACMAALNNYCTYGPETVSSMTLDNEKVKSLTSEQLIESIKNLMGTCHRIFYYGPLTSAEASSVISAAHNTSGLKEGKKIEYQQAVTDHNRVVFAQYDSKQVIYTQSFCEGLKYDLAIEPERRLFNKYFGSDLVYQELREARGLAYTAFARYNAPRVKDQSYSFMAYIGTQSDKVRQAAETFEQIIENMPEAENNFCLAKESLLSTLATTRYCRDEIFDKWIFAQDLGEDFDEDSIIYDAIEKIEMEELKKFHDSFVRGRVYTYSILGNSNDVDMKYLESLGKIEKPSQKEYFGY